MSTSTSTATVIEPGFQRGRSSNFAVNSKSTAVITLYHEARAMIPANAMNASQLRRCAMEIAQEAASDLFAGRLDIVDAWANVRAQMERLLDTFP